MNSRLLAHGWLGCENGRQMFPHELIHMASTGSRERDRDILATGWNALEHAPAVARRQARAVLRSEPSDAEATLLLAAAHRREGNAVAAKKRLAPLMAQQIESPVAWFEWGLTLAENGDDSGAVEPLRRAAALAPAFTGAWRALGDQLLALGRAPEGGAAYAGAARAATKDPRLATAAAALAEGNAAEAEKILKVHVQLFPGDVRAIWLLGEAAIRVNGSVEAEAVLKHCLTLAPEFADARHTLAMFFYLQHRFGEAAEHMKALLKLLPYQPALRILLATCLCKIGNHQEALGIFEKMLASCPTHHSMLLIYGHSLKAVGRERDAERAYRACLPLAPGWAPSLYLSLADLKTVRLTDADLSQMRQPGPHVSDFGRAQLSYAIGHTLDQRADYAGAFAAFAEGAAMRRRDITYDADATSAFVQAAKTFFTPAFFESRAGSGCQATGPIFVVGLPRAGSTLVEQILASHSQVEGTSELRTIGQMAAGLLAGRSLDVFPGIVGALDPAVLSTLGEGYLSEAAQFRRLGRPFFIDKMPGNVLHLGFIHLILPNARIIDVRRAPMASGFSAFRQFFQLDQTGANFSYDLREIGRYYKDYVELTAHFDAVLPGRVFRLQYEDLVTNTEHQVRALLEHCGLPFEASCLRYWETDRAVQTPSAQQVRRPISREGLDHWRHYAAWLGELEE